MLVPSEHSIPPLAVKLAGLPARTQDAHASRCYEDRITAVERLVDDVVCTAEEVLPRPAVRLRHSPCKHLGVHWREDEGQGLAGLKAFQLHDCIGFFECLKDGGNCFPKVIVPRAPFIDTAAQVLGEDRHPRFAPDIAHEAAIPAPTVPEGSEMEKANEQPSPLESFDGLNGISCVGDNYNSRIVELPRIDPSPLRIVDLPDRFATDVAAWIGITVPHAIAVRIVHEFPRLDGFWPHHDQHRLAGNEINELLEFPEGVLSQEFSRLVTHGVLLSASKRLPIPTESRRYFTS